ncbi:PDDEXK nuclease domain-containing protein, partial [Cupriavidus sp. 8B]
KRFFDDRSRADLAGSRLTRLRPRPLIKKPSALCRPRHNLDLLFYHLKLRCYIVIELKTGAFKPEYAEQISFYLSAVDAEMKTAADNPTIGLLLCQEHNRLVVEYALRGMGNPIGVAQYQLVAELPAELQESLPSVEALTQELEPDTRRNEGD